MYMCVHELQDMLFQIKLINERKTSTCLMRYFPLYRACTCMHMIIIILLANCVCVCVCVKKTDYATPDTSSGVATPGAAPEILLTNF